MSKRSDEDLLSDIQEAAQRIATYTAGMTYDVFLGDQRRKMLSSATYRESI